MATSGGKEAVRWLALTYPLLVTLLFGTVACGPTRPAGETDPPLSAPAATTSDLPPPLDPEGPREIVLGKLFAPDGSIETADRTSKFSQGARIFLSVESGDLPRGTTVAAAWTAPDGTFTEQAQTTIGGESYLVFTAPSPGWTAGAGQVAVRIGEPPQEMRREIAFEVSP